MAFDGITIANLVHEFQDTIRNGRINKIAQTENDELMLTIKNNREQYRLLLSASASLPLLYLSSTNKPSPATAPGFCMLLRKHILNGKIISITQPDFERIVKFEIEHYNELGDLCTKYLIIELMGKHSNIIFCNDNDMIIDSIKHIPSFVSSIREVLPGRPYFIPETNVKYNPLTITRELFFQEVYSKTCNVSKALYTTLTGISPMIAEEICFRSSISSELPADTLQDTEKLHLFHMFTVIMEDIRECRYTPNIIMSNSVPTEYSSISLTHYESSEKQFFQSVSVLLENYYAVKNAITRVRQKSVDLRKIVQNSLERNYKKYDLQIKQLEDTNKREKYKVYGELINTYGYQVPEGSTSFEALNYYTNEMITIPLDKTISALDNAKKYFDKYTKLKRTYDALIKLVEDTKTEIDYLESISTALSIALQEEDLAEIKEELINSGYMKRKGGVSKIKITSKPLHYVSDDGFDIMVGKNNYQNDNLTFKYAAPDDWWFHAKGIPGSHVIVRTNGKEISDLTFEQAARLAAFYSKAKDNEKVEIDYTRKKNVKKPNGSNPGFVIYYTNYSMVIDSDISNVKKA